MFAPQMLHSLGICLWDLLIFVFIVLPMFVCLICHITLIYHANLHKLEIIFYSTVMVYRDTVQHYDFVWFLIVCLELRFLAQFTLLVKGFKRLAYS